LGILVSHCAGRDNCKDGGAFRLDCGLFNLAVKGACGALLLSVCAATSIEAPPTQTTVPLVPSQEVLDRSASQRLGNQEPSLGAANVPKLSQSEMQALVTQLRECWAPPIAVAKTRDLVVSIHLALNRDGTLSGEPSVVNKGSTGLFQIAAQSAMQAVRRCQPFRLPTSKYEAWREVVVSFASNGMLER
jgi:hypothetical protein